ncbi:26S proteasome regulatory subunit N10 [Blastomyces parvus]|uniref:26S proteasome regulatory subunit N10 n=1 Tax=Blastomyces parvus TaxID=2060905 RepID=A0A2B7WI80_9EURO|nr:26S proteasome regulatory subunit N10 [Blastomyces parvus]
MSSAAWSWSGAALGPVGTATSPSQKRQQLASFSSISNSVYKNIHISLRLYTSYPISPPLSPHVFPNKQVTAPGAPTAKMVLEATMIMSVLRSSTECVDNSESSRNGDYLPTRFDAQADAINLIHSAKTQANPESSVGLMSMAGKGPEVLVTLTADIGKILDGLHRTKIRGQPHLASSIQVAGLALKHRRERAQRQRIIVFTCSPIAEDEKTLIKLAKRMKKYNVSVDFVAFGDLDDDTIKKLEAFNENVNGADGSHLAIIHPGANLLSDSLLTTPILGGDASGVGRAGGEEGVEGGVDIGFDPAADPELAFALRMSLEEEQARIEKERKEKEEKEKQEKAVLEGIAEEGGETQPLLDKDGEPSGSGSNERKKDDKDKGADGDKMDTA